MPLRATSVDTDRRQANRRGRYDAQRVVWKETQLQRVAYCGRALRAGGDTVAVKVSHTESGLRGGFSGLQTCGSVWACTVCSEKINAGRQAELEAGITRWISQGHAVVFVTLTVRHHRRHRLAPMWDAISPAWNRTTSGAGVAWNGGKSTIGDRALFGIAGYVRLVEVKHGQNGWHPHVHALLFLERDLADHDLDQLRHRLFGRWDKALRREGFSALEFDAKGQAVGVDVRRVTDGQYLADYFAKNGYRPSNTTAASGAAYEVTGSHSKRAGKGGRTPFELLASMVDASTGEVPAGWSPDAFEADRKLWWEWEQASKGRRQLTWSRGMKDRLGLNDVTDEELAEEEADGEVVHVFTRDEWREGRWWLRKSELLEAAEKGILRRLFAGARALAAAGPPATPG